MSANHSSNSFASEAPPSGEAISNNHPSPFSDQFENTSTSNTNNPISPFSDHFEAINMGNVLSGPSRETPDTLERIYTDQYIGTDDSSSEDLSFLRDSPKRASRALRADVDQDEVSEVLFSNGEDDDPDWITDSSDEFDEYNMSDGDSSRDSSYSSNSSGSSGGSSGGSGDSSNGSSGDSFDGSSDSSSESSSRNGSSSFSDSSSTSELSKMLSWSAVAEEEGRFIDPSFRRCLPKGIKGWDKIHVYSSKELKNDTRMNDIFGGGRGRPMGSRYEHLDPMPERRHRRMCQPDCIEWGEIKELMARLGKTEDIKMYERRWRAEDRTLESMFESERGRSYHESEKLHSSDDDSEWEDEEDESWGEGASGPEERKGMVPLTKWDYLNPLNWSLDFAPVWLQEFVAWILEVERLYEDDDTNWLLIAVAMLIYWAGGVLGLLMVWVMSRSMLVTGQWQWEGEGHPIPL